MRQYSRPMKPEGLPLPLPPAASVGHDLWALTGLSKRRRSSLRLLGRT
jgi:hypothetical protein